MINIEIYSANGGIIIRPVKFDSLINFGKDLRCWRYIQCEIMKLAFSEKAFTVVTESNGDFDPVDSTLLLYGGLIDEYQSYDEFEISDKKYISINIEPPSNFFNNYELYLKRNFAVSDFWIVGTVENPLKITEKIIENQSHLFDEDKWFNTNNEFMVCVGDDIFHSFFYGNEKYTGLFLIWNGATVSAKELKQHIVSKSKEKGWNLNISLSNQKKSSKSREKILPKGVFEDYLKILNKNRASGYCNSVRILVSIVKMFLYLIGIVLYIIILLGLVFFMLKIMCLL